MLRPPHKIRSGRCKVSRLRRRKPKAANLTPSQTRRWLARIVEEAGKSPKGVAAFRARPWAEESERATARIRCCRLHQSGMIDRADRRSSDRLPAPSTGVAL